MFNFKNKKTLLITGGVVVVLLIILWFMLRGNSSQTDSSLVAVASDPVELIIGREMITALNEMKLVRLDTTFFNDPVFNSFQDFTVIIPDQPIGRRDPFAPI